jgi:queuine/archaeosine tRNA-ribosyltransferase
MANYIPAEMPALVLHYLENKQNKSLFWGTKTSVIQYPFMLVSTYFGLKVPNFRDELKKYDLMDNFLIFGDSGGFQNYSMNANLNPIDVLRWQEKNCDIAATFDYPIGPDDNNNKIKEKQIKTVDNAYMALNNKQTNIKIYAAVQGHSIDEQQFK